VSVQPVISARLLAGFGIVGIGLLVALVTDVALSALSPAKVAFILGGFALLIPTMVMQDPKSYWLFLLILSIPFDISKWLSDPEITQTLVDAYGSPMSGTTSLEIYLTDVVLVAMLLPWLARVCLRRETLYFPRIGCLFVFYLAWALLVSLINAASFYLSIFELCRQALYFLFFVYLINNVSTPAQFRSVIWAVLLGFIIGAGTVIVFFERGIGTDTAVFASLHDEPAANGPSQTHKPKKESAAQELTVVNPDGGRNLGSMGGGKESEIKRSQGMFRHPAIPAGLCGLILPIALAYLITARKNRDRILFLLLIVWGLIALALTFSRAGLIGLMVGAVVFFAVAGWSGLIPRRVFKLGAIALTLSLALSIPLLTIYFKTRPGSFTMRFYMFEAAVQGYSEHPILGVGLNNSTAAMKTGRQELKDMGILIPGTEPADSYYLAILTEVGPVGSILYFVFFGCVVTIGLRSMRQVPVDMKPLLVGMVAGLAALATQSIADGPLAGHAVGGTLWLFVALIIAIARHAQAETQPSRRMGALRPSSLQLQSHLN
jgi:O-Antigen ligase